MRVTLVSPFDPRPDGGPTAGAHVGGVERCFDHLSRELARRGHEVTLVCSSPRPGEQRRDGVRVVRGRRYATVLRAPVARLASRIERDTDLVQVAATYPFTTASVLERARRLRRPSVLDFHFEPAPGTAAGRIAARLWRGIGPRSYPLAEAVLVRSESYARTAPSLARVPRSRWHVVPNGVDTARFRPDGPAWRGDYLLFVGRLVPYKGLDVLLEAVSRLPEARPLVVAGDGPLRGTLEAAARRLGVQTTFLGHVPDDELPALYRGARATLLPSVTRQEAFGIALLESMACGTPVVASDLPGVAEVAQVGGRVARTGDAASLAAQVRRALQDEDLVRGPALAERVRASYSWAAVAERLLDVYRGIVGDRSMPEGDPAPVEVNALADPRRHPLL